MSRPRTKPKDRTERASAGRLVSASVVAPLLTKVAKHMALLACFMIVGSATGRATINELGIFSLIAAAALVYSVGRSLEGRLPTAARFSRP